MFIVLGLELKFSLSMHIEVSVFHLFQQKIHKIVFNIGYNIDYNLI